jgi:Protein of unknown function (DUF2934)
MHTHHRKPHCQKRAALARSSATGPATSTQAATACCDRGCGQQSVAAEAIRSCAYGKWENAGKPTGDGIRFWLEAEQELRQCR